MFQANNIEEAFKILEANEALFEQKKIETDTKDNNQSKDWLVALLVLKGKVLENMDNREQASDVFKGRKISQAIFLAFQFFQKTKEKQLSNSALRFLNGSIKHYDIIWPLISIKNGQLFFI